MTTQTPLVPPAASPTPPKKRGATLAVSVVTIVVGGCIFVGTLIGSGATAMSTLGDRGHSGSGGAGSASSSVRGLTDLDVEVAGGALTIAYGDVTDARLDVDGRGSAGWTFERDGDTLRVASPRGGLVDWAASGPAATLTLPQALAGSVLDAKVEVAGGIVNLDADLKALTVQVAGGTVDLSGRADVLDVEVSGGAAKAELSEVSTAAFEVAGGDLSAKLAGAAPARTTVKVTAGSADLTLPGDEYRVAVDAGLGNVDNRLRTSSSATSVVEVEAALGQVSLKS